MPQTEAGYVKHITLFLLLLFFFSVFLIFSLHFLFSASHWASVFVPTFLSLPYPLVYSTKARISYCRQSNTKYNPHMHTTQIIPKHAISILQKSQNMQKWVKTHPNTKTKLHKWSIIIPVHSGFTLTNKNNKSKNNHISTRHHITPKLKFNSVLIVQENKQEGWESIQPAMHKCRLILRFDHGLCLKLKIQVLDSCTKTHLINTQIKQ